MTNIQPGIRAALEAAGFRLEEVMHHRSENLGAPETHAQREARIASTQQARGEALPVPSGIEADICADIARRQQLGIHKYGRTVAENPLPLDKWLQHLYEELLDAAIYAKRAQAEIAATQYRVSDMRELVTLFAEVEKMLPGTKVDRDAAMAVRKKIYDMITGGAK